MPKVLILLASAKQYQITAAESWAGGEGAKWNKLGWTWTLLFNCLYNQQRTNLQLSALCNEKIGGGGRKGNPETSIMPAECLLTVLCGSGAVICQSLASGAEWKRRCWARASTFSPLWKFWSGSLQTLIKVNINSLIHETWQVTPAHSLCTWEWPSKGCYAQREEYSFTIMLFGVPQLKHRRQTWRRKVASLPRAAGAFKAPLGCGFESVCDFLKAYSEILRSSFLPGHRALDTWHFGGGVLNWTALTRQRKRTCCHLPPPAKAGSGQFRCQ